jgi:hypothetical protein
LGKAEEEILRSKLQRAAWWVALAVAAIADRLEWLEIIRCTHAALARRL